MCNHHPLSFITVNNQQTLPTPSLYASACVGLEDIIVVVLTGVQKPSEFSVCWESIRCAAWNASIPDPSNDACERPSIHSPVPLLHTCLLPVLALPHSAVICWKGREQAPALASHCQSNVKFAVELWFPEIKRYCINSVSHLALAPQLWNVSDQQAEQSL